MRYPCRLFVTHRFYIVYLQGYCGPVDPSFRAVSGHLKFTVRRHKFNEDSLSCRRTLESPESARRRERTLTTFPSTSGACERCGVHYILHRVTSSLLGPVDPSFGALSGRLKFTVRRHKFNEDSLLSLSRARRVCWSLSSCAPVVARPPAAPTQGVAWG